MKMNIPVLLADGAPVFQVEVEMEELREVYRTRPEEKEKEEKQEEREAGSSDIRTRSPLNNEEQVGTCWQETLQRLLAAQELGNNYVRIVTMVTRLPGIGVPTEVFLRDELK